MSAQPIESNAKPNPIKSKPAQRKPTEVKRGNVTIKIYYGTNSVGQKEYAQFSFFYYSEGKRLKKRFAHLEDAKREAELIATKLANGENEVLKLTATDRAIYLEATEYLRPLNVSLVVAASEYAQARKLLGDASLREAAQFYVKRHGLNLTEKTVSQVVAELVAEKTKDLSERHVADLESRLSRFGKAFQCRLASINGHLVREWINSLTGVKGHNKNTKPKPLSARSKNNYLLAVQNLISYAKEKRYLPKDWDELDLKPIKLTDRDVEVFTADEVSKLLSHANDKILPFVALSAFAGIRSAELERLDWSKIDLTEGNITIDASIAKTNSRRVIPIADNLKQWLQPLVQRKGSVCEYDNVTNALMKLAAEAGMKWKRNGLRHAFGSFRTAQTSDIPRVSFEMGNSPPMVRKHYLKLSTPKEAQTYFSITPEAQANVVNLPAAVKAA